MKNAKKRELLFLFLKTQMVVFKQFNGVVLNSMRTLPSKCSARIFELSLHLKEEMVTTVVPSGRKTIKIIISQLTIFKKPQWLGCNSVICHFSGVCKGLDWMASPQKQKDFGLI